MHEAVRKSHLVKAKLTSLTSEVEFWDWYKKEIEEDTRLIDDQLTFAEAIALVEEDFWSRPDRRKRDRSKDNPSDVNSWIDTYGRFYKLLPQNKTVNLSDIERTIERWTKGTKTYKGVVAAMKRLTRAAKNKKILEELDSLSVVQTKYKKLNNITLEDFLSWRDKVLDITIDSHPNTQLDVRKAWMWVFSVQVVYGLRIHEVFAIVNSKLPFIAEDGVTIPALNDSNNTDNLIVIGGLTSIQTTTKTGYRIARPNIPPKYPDLLEKLEIKIPLIPDNKPKGKSEKAKVNFYSKTARDRLDRWNAPTTQTHALRHLANINGMQAGIPLEVRAQSMGHTPAMNDSVYKKRQSTQTTIDLLLNSNQNAIDFVTALAEAKKLVKEDESDKAIIARLLSIIYQKNEKDISKLL
jgi:integrase